MNNTTAKQTNENFKPAITQEGKAFIKPKILVVEDDVTFEPFWAGIAERANRNSQVFWATSEMEAENMIFDAMESGHPFDLVITDIFLSGSRTGIDLWLKFVKHMHGKIIVTSGIEYQKFVQYFGNSELRPIYLQKPLVPHECIGAIYSALTEGHK